MLSKFSRIALGSALLLSLISPEVNAQTGNTGYVLLGDLINSSDPNLSFFWVSNYYGESGTDLSDLFELSYSNSGHKVSFKVAFDQPQDSYVGMDVSYLCSSGELLASELHFALFGVDSHISPPEYIDVDSHWFFASLGSQFCDASQDDLVALPLPELEPEPIESSVETEPEPIESPVEAESESIESSVETEPEPIESPVEAEPEPIESPVETEPEPIETPSELESLQVDEPLGLEPVATAGVMSSGILILGGSLAVKQKRKRRKKRENDLQKSLDIAENIFSDKMIEEVKKRRKLIDQIIKKIESSRDSEVRQLLNSLKLAKSISINLESTLSQGKNVVDDFNKLKSGDPKNVSSAIQRIMGMVKGAAPVLQAFTLQLEISTELIGRVEIAWRNASSALEHIASAQTSAFQSVEQQVHEELASKVGEEIEKILSPEGFIKDVSDAVLNHLFKGSQDELLKYVPESFKEASNQIMHMHSQIFSGAK